MDGWKISVDERLGLFAVGFANDIDNTLIEERVEPKKQEILTRYQNAVKQGDKHYI